MRRAVHERSVVARARRIRGRRPGTLVEAVGSNRAGSGVCDGHGHAGGGRRVAGRVARDRGQRVRRRWRAVVVFQATRYGAVVSSAPRFAPSSLNCTPATPTLSAASAVTSIVPRHGRPAAGAVIVDRRRRRVVVDGDGDRRRRRRVARGVARDRGQRVRAVAAAVVFQRHRIGRGRVLGAEVRRRRAGTARRRRRRCRSPSRVTVTVPSTRRARRRAR